ncbi:imm11 family protein [Sorangium sp. So ce1024]|uniref:imm11 family protein n=2 Tax=unclassified Sorangium TaxID=2621164 RepID=UPI003F08F9F6
MMRRFFVLRDEMTIKGRWHLGEIRLRSGWEPLLDAGHRLDAAEPLRGEVTHAGRVLDFSLTSFNVPVATTALANAVRAIAGGDVQCIPVEIAGQTGMFVLNSVRVIRCLDEERSAFIKWTKQDHRSELAGQYRQITKHVLDENAIPNDAHFFRIEGSLVELIVSGAVKAGMESIGCFGANFVEVPLSRSGA